MYLDIFWCFKIWKKFYKQKKFVENCHFLWLLPTLINNISGTAEPIFDFFFLKCAEFNLESPIKFSISLIVFSQNAKNWFMDLATMKLAILRNSDVMEKNLYRIRTQRPKISKDLLVPSNAQICNLYMEEIYAWLISSPS